MSVEPSNPPEMSEARKRAEARKAKILARGSAGLAKLASTARGEEGSVLYDTSTPSRSSTPVQTAPATQPSRHSAPPSPSQPSSADPSLEYQAQIERMMSMMSGGAPGEPDMVGGFAGQPDLMAQMQAMLGGASGPGMSPSLALRDVDPMADFPTPGAAGSAPDFGDMMGMNGFPGMPPGFDPASMMGGPGGMGIGFGGQPQPKSLVAKIFPLVHILFVIAFWAFTVGFWEPSVRAARLGVAGLANEKWLRYGMLDGARSILPGSDMLMERLPVFWAFITMEVLLQSTQFMLFKPSRPTGGVMGLLSNFLPLLPPNIQLAINTTTRYASMASQIWKDGCLLVFLMGLTVAWAGRQSVLGSS